ncbi:MAG: ribbon-helix-helix protein, CopG family [Sphingomonadales bacterium]|nr:ribbon-helix-helix protein, CopG family [Sphingomonadales bacterium]
MSESTPLGFRVPPEKAAALEKLAAATDRPKSWLLEQALDAYLETNAWQVAHIEQGLADLKAGKAVPHDKVADWLKSWGGSAERKRPR